jgi:uncharacterized protein involved in oxidation of intracellular sulfur
MKTLIIINEKPSANEKAYNAVRIADQLQKDDSANSVVIYLIGDGVYCSLANVDGSAGPLNIEARMTDIIRHGGSVKMCTSCGESRGLTNKNILQGAEWTNLKTLTNWLTESDKILNY